MTNQRRIVIIFVVLFAGWLLPTLFMTQRPAAIIGPALAKLNGDLSFTASATIAMPSPKSALAAAGFEDARQIPLVFVGDGGANFPKDKPPSGKATFIVTSAGGSENPLTFDVVAAQDGNSFVKLTNLPTDEAEEKNAAVLKALNGRWFSMPSRQLSAMAAHDVTPEADAVAGAGTRPAATWQTVRNQLAGGELFGVPTSLGFAGLKNIHVRRYKLPMQVEALIPFMQDIKSVQKGRSLTAAELAEVKAAVESSNASLEIWIDTKREVLQQARLTVASKETTDTISMVLTFTSWDGPVNVIAPSESTPYADIVKPAPKADATN